MLHYAIVFFIIAIIAGILGFTEVMGASAWIAQILFVVFLIFAIIGFIAKPKRR